MLPFSESHLPQPLKLKTENIFFKSTNTWLLTLKNLFRFLHDFSYGQTTLPRSKGIPLYLLRTWVSNLWCHVVT